MQKSVKFQEIPKIASKAEFTGWIHKYITNDSSLPDVENNMKFPLHMECLVLFQSSFYCQGPPKYPQMRTPLALLN